jgi:sporulation protein YlmC with PRC-barrel domain
MTVAMKYALTATTVLAGLAIASTSVDAQTQSQSAAERAAQSQAKTAGNASPENPNIRQLMTGDAEKLRVTPDELYRGFRAHRLLGMDVRGPNGNEIGEVQDILVSRDGKITAVVVEGGGFLGVGNAAFRVAWKDVDTTPGKDGVKVPITESTASQYDLFDGPDWVATGPREFRITELLGDYARLKNGTGYGYVDDAVFSRDGKLLGVLTTRRLTYGGGLYGYPFYGYGYGWDPGLGYYALPYDTADAAGSVSKLDARHFEDSEKQIF